LLQEKYYQTLKGSAGELPKTQISTEFGNYNSLFFDSKFGITQSFATAGFYKKQSNLLESYFKTATAQTLIQKAELKKLIEQLYVELQFLYAKKQVLQNLDGIYSSYQKIAKLRFDKGESNLLEKTTLDNQSAQNLLMLQMLQSDIRSVQLQISVVLQNDILIEPADTLGRTRKLFDQALLKDHPYLKFYQQQQLQSVAQTELEKARLKPEFFAGYNNQSIVGWQLNKDKTETYYAAGNRFSSVSAGISVPIFNKAIKAKIQAAKINEQVSSASFDLMHQNLQNRLVKAFQSYEKFCDAVDYYGGKGLLESNTIIKTADLNYRNGQINYIEWATLFHQAFAIQLEYVNALREQHIAESEINYLLQNN
ncbi:MAG TPA: TolC family protein, partial [Chitinophagaceae bacterium]|nr:TolC family protein [Chitinophagaceae bacterium]